MTDNEATLCQQSRESLALDRDNAIGRNRLDDRTLEYVAAGVDLVGRRVLSLFQEGGYPSIGIGRHAAKGTRISHVEQMHGDIGILVMVRGEDSLQVHSGQHIAIEDHDRVIAQLVVDIADAAAGTECGLFHHVLNLQAQIGAITEVLLKDLSLI